MKKEEAIRWLMQYQGYEQMDDGVVRKHAFDLTDETVDALLAALRPVRREQVEKVWRGEWFNYRETSVGVPKRLCSRCGCGFIGFDTKFCENCGAPMTDEAVEMVIERLEELHD